VKIGRSIGTGGSPVNGKGRLEIIYLFLGTSYSGRMENEKEVTTAEGGRRRLFEKRSDSCPFLAAQARPLPGGVDLHSDMMLLPRQAGGAAGDTVQSLGGLPPGSDAQMLMRKHPASVLYGSLLWHRLRIPGRSPGDHFESL
jgi:hypothetical protein